MQVAAVLLVTLVVLIHVYILVLEMFLWTTPQTVRAFGITHEFAAESATLAANQGLYNGFLAAGLLFGLLADDLSFKVFFLVCVIIAGIFGALSVSKRILFVQTVPAAFALLTVVIAA